LKLELAQYRELEAFAKFGSDLDKATQQQLRRGARLTEILKQKQYKPLPVEKQIALLWTATNGYLDNLPIEILSTFETEFYEFMDMKYSNVLESIIRVKDLTDEIVANLKAAVEDFVEVFKKKHNLK